MWKSSKVNVILNSLSQWESSFLPCLTWAGAYVIFLLHHSWKFVVADGSTESLYAWHGSKNILVYLSSMLSMLIFGTRYSIESVILIWLSSRFLTTGWTGSLSWDMVEVYAALPASDRQRIENIEFLDEQELLIQLFQHYCICIAWKGEMFSKIDIT